MAAVPRIVVIEPSISGSYRIAADQPRDGSTGTRPICDVRRTRFSAEKQTVAVKRSGLARIYRRAWSVCNRICSTSAGIVTRLTTTGQISIGGAATRVDGRLTT